MLLQIRARSEFLRAGIALVGLEASVNALMADEVRRLREADSAAWKIARKRLFLVVHAAVFLQRAELRESLLAHRAARL